MKIAMRMALSTVLFPLLLIGCEQGPDSPRGFSLPEGDAEQGRQVFLEMNCLACHNITGMDQEVEKELETPVPLGGLVTRPVTYAELVTSIINPSHTISRRVREDLITENGESRMRNYNEVMTVSQLVDLVTFLETEYDLVEYPRTHYLEYP